MKSIKAFLKEKGFYLVCLALVFAATITGILAVRNVVRGVGELTEAKHRQLEEESSWDFGTIFKENHLSLLFPDAICPTLCFRLR